MVWTCEVVVLTQVYLQNRRIYHAFWLLWIPIWHLLLANCCFDESNSARLSGLVPYSWSFLVVQLGGSDYGPFYFICYDFHLVQVSRKWTFFDFDLLAYGSLIWRVVLSGSFLRASLGLLTGENPGAVLVFHWDVRSLWVLLMLLGSYRRVYLPCVFLWLLVVIFFYSPRPILTHI